MTRIGIISDTHGFLDDAVFRHFAQCDEVWHAGDFGNTGLAENLKMGIENAEERGGRPVTLRGVYGNIDGQDIRSHYPEQLLFTCEAVKVLIRHIGGAPPKYNPETRQQLQQHRPNLFVCGHSHILKIVYDQQMQCLYMNPGAAGKQGWHKTRTLIRFSVDGADMRHCEVVELGKR